MLGLFPFLLYLAHIQAVFFPFFIGLKSINRFNHISKSTLIPYGFIFLGFASLFEMFDHFHTRWIYVNHSSLFNWFFYNFLSLGLTLLSISVLNKDFRKLNIFCLLLCFSSISAYWPLGKIFTILFQILISLFLIINWHNRFKDYLLIVYPIFGIIFTTIFGMNLISSNNQIWHIFIGPSGSISALTFYFILVRSWEKVSSAKD